MAPRRAYGQAATLLADLSDREAPRLDDFLVGESNALAHSACRAVLKAPGALYNPLFIHGAPGTGKTHLAAALARHLEEKHRDLQVEYIAAEGFVQSYMRAAQSDELAGFRHCFRNVDCLLVDDVAYLAGKRRSEEEFFHTIDTLLADERQVVLTARTAPRLLAGLDDRLISRFQGGLVVQIDPPDYDLRRRILKAEVKARSWRLSPASLDLLAERLPANARELRGAVIRLQADERVSGRTPTRRVIEGALDDARGGEQTSMLERIVHAVLRRFNLRLRQLQSKKRSRAVTLPRHMAMYLTRELTDLSLEEIGSYFGGRDHSTVLHACRKMERLADEDTTIASTLREIKGHLQRE